MSSGPLSKPTLSGQSDIVPPSAALYNLALSLFSEEHFRRWIRHDEGTSKLVAELPGEGVPPSVLIEKGLTALARHGYIDDAFFRRLREEFPRRGEEIGAVERLWLGATLSTKKETQTKSVSSTRDAVGQGTRRLSRSTLIATAAAVLLGGTGAFLVYVFATKGSERPSSSLMEPQRANCPDGMLFIEGAREGAFGERIPDFCMDTTEVTVAAHQKCVKTGACADAPRIDGCNNGVPGRHDHPINCVTWNAARDYCAAQGKRLPTEWEWEWAARGRDEGRNFPWGEELPDCRYAIMKQGGDGCGRSGTWPVDSKPDGRSRDGLADLVGNVMEWTSTAVELSYAMKGGSWADASRMRNADYVSIPPSFMTPLNGFRCIRNPG